MNEAAYVYQTSKKQTLERTSFLLSGMYKSMKIQKQLRSLTIPKYEIPQMLKQTK